MIFPWPFHLFAVGNDRISNCSHLPTNFVDVASVKFAYALFTLSGFFGFCFRFLFEVIRERCGILILGNGEKKRSGVFVFTPADEILIDSRRRICLKDAFERHSFLIWQQAPRYRNQLSVFNSLFQNVFMNTFCDNV